MTGTEMRPGEIGVAAAEGLRELLTRAVGGEPIAVYVEGRPLDWTALRTGGWDELGVRAEDGGPGADLRDLVEVAMIWGEWCAPAPLVITIVAKRLSATARAHPGPMSVAVAAPALEPRALVPFGAEPGVRILSALGTGADTLLPETDPGSGGETDAFAPSLRPQIRETATEFAPEAARALAVLWAAEGVGCARRCLQDAVGYAKTRTQFDHPIGSFQAIKHRLARALELTERAETAVLWSAVEPFGDHARITARRLALHALTTAQQVVESAIQVHGGMGFTWEQGLHVYLRHVLTLLELVAGLPG